METTKKIELSPEAKALKVTELLTTLKTFGKGERASKEAKKIRRNLRKLGHYISKANQA